MINIDVNMVARITERVKVKERRATFYSEKFQSPRWESNP